MSYDPPVVTYIGNVFDLLAFVPCCHPMVEGEPIFLPSGARVDVVTTSAGTRVYAFRNTAVLTEPDIYALMREVMIRFNEAIRSAGFTLHESGDAAAATLVIREVLACTRCGLVGHLAEECPTS